VKRANLIIEIVHSIAIIPDGIIRAVYVRECSNILNVDERVLYTEINKIIHKVKEDSWKNEQRSNLPSDQEREKLPDNSAFLRSANECDGEERALVRTLLNFGSEVLFSQIDEAGNEEKLLVGQYIIAELTNDELESINPLYQLVFDQYGENMEKETFNAKTFFRDYSNEKVNQLAADILSEPHQLSGLWTRKESVIETEEEKLVLIVPKLVNEYKGKKVRLLMKDVMQEMQKAQDTGNSDRMMELMKQKMVLDQIKNAISKELGNRTIS
jgi:DNA primase